MALCDRGRRSRRLGPVLAVVLCGTVAVACDGRGSSTNEISRRQSLGEGTPTPLILEPATVTPAVKVSRTAAKNSVEHPFSAPQVTGGLKQFGLARVTVTGLAAEGTGPTPSYKNHLAWVGIYEVSKSADHSCPGEPASLPSDLPPVFAHYYFAVLVDAAKGTQTTWNEDMSGLLIRQCTGVPTG